MDAAALGAELLAMATEDLRVREELARDGSLFDGYHPRMREVHERNAERLSAILDERGWPGRSLVGEKAAQAAWRQLYGTQFDWDEHGQLSPLPIEDEASVDLRRREIGLDPLAHELQRQREFALREREQPPRDWQARQRDTDNWLRTVGWRTST